MGGKTKQNQRTKNNAKPSNSGRSAELLGASVPAFVGFSAHSDLGMIPFAPGFSTTENLPETFDSSISTQFQLVLRKMSKKDPITKVKALQEFTDLISESEIDMVKGILPLWPKFYHNLANDVDHRVRESAQNVQSLIVSKCKKSVAPYIKQLTPVWINSQFDNYPPAASTAVASFQSVFVANKMLEVCLFCQQEILDFVVRNLTFHTASTLTSAKTCTPEEAEHKYQRTVACSMKTLSFFLDKTAGSDLSACIEKIHSLLSHQKFWTFAKHRTAYIRSAWFELIYNVLHHIPQSTKEIKAQLIPLCFQNIDDKDPLTVPHVWGCILLLQSAYDDWYKSINFKKNIQGKLSTFLRGACSGNAESVCPNLLPFLSKLTQETLQDVPVEEFYKDFFKDLKDAITSATTTSKAELTSLTVAFYECIRYILQRLNVQSKTEDVSSDLPQFILDEYVNETLKWALTTEKVGTKSISVHTSTLIAYWSDQTDSPLYSKMVAGFWQALTKDVSGTPFTKQYLENVVDLVNCLYYANPTLQSNKVKFTTNDDEDSTDGGGRQKSKPTRSYVQTDLRQLVVLLVRKCLLCLSERQTLQFESEIHQLIKLYGDAAFYAEISGENDMGVTLNRLTDLVCDAASAPSEVILEIVFDILNYLDKEKKLQFINKLLKTKKPSLQQSILQRLLSYPMCIEPEVRDMLSQDHVIEIILQTAEEVLIDDSKEKFNLLHKCFFQTDSGEILINQKTVDGILDITTRPLIRPEEYKAMMDSCGSFIAQIMPVVCSNNSSEQAQKQTFLKLFQFTINQRMSDDLSEDTLWEVTTCWQDALSSQDITMDDVLLQKCSEIISERLAADITHAEIDSVADCLSKLILCSTENSEEGEKRQDLIDSHMKILFKPAKENFCATYEKISKFCIFLEVLQGALTVTELPDDAGKDPDLDMFFRRSQLNLTALMKMVCPANVADILANREKPVDDEECTEDYFDPNENLLKKWTEDMYDLVFELIKIAAIGESLIQNKSTISKDLVDIILEISEKGKVLLRAVNEENSAQIKDRLLKNAAFNDVAATRAIRYLVEIPQYATFQESALILLQEDLTEYFITRESQATYVNLLQFILPELTSRVINLDNPILRKDSNVWQKCAVFRCLLTNNFEASCNEISDKKIVNQVLSYITEVSESQKQTSKELLLYNTNVAKQDVVTLAKVVEYIRLLNDVLQKFPYELTIKHWDAIRIGLSSWVLSVAKRMQNYTNSKVSIFLTSVYRLYGTLACFIKSEKTKSSTEVLKNMIDEWENLFATEVNLVLFKSFYEFISLNEIEGYSTCYTTIFKEIASSIQSLDYSVIYKFCKSSKQITLDSLVHCFLNNISSPMFSLRITSVDALCQLSEFFIATDMEIFEKRSDVVDAKASESESLSNWHFLHKFKDHIETYEAAILKYLDEFSFKMTELAELKPIDKESALSYMLLWDCILSVCKKAPVELRSVYTSWLTEYKFDQRFLHFLFRAMPVEILKNHDSKLMTNDLFKVAKWEHLKNENLPIEKYACYLYSAVLSKLPAVVRKWWNASHSRQKVFVDKLTTNFVSGFICHQELDTIGEIHLKEKQNNMQVQVHTSTREVNAVYFIDEARMELIITLAPNYPLGGVKVESGKQIGGRASSRNTAMQLTIFLTHQNGSIFDGLLLWKKNLDKKFEGVEECYVCYTVIHQDTCQLPKLTCKTCRKKFHSPCLYKWFTTSSKSTCPICRNIF